MITKVPAITGKVKYKADFYLGPKRVIRIFSNKSLAELCEMRLKNQHTESKYLPFKEIKKVSFEDLCSQWIEVYAKANMVDPTSDTYKANSIKEDFKGKMIDELTSFDIEKVKSKWMETLSNSSVNRRLTVLKSMFNRAVEWGLLSKSPAKVVKKLRENEGKTRYLTKEEITLLLTSTEGDMKKFILFAIYTGMRLGNLQRLEGSNIKDGVIHVTKTKSGKDYTIPIHPQLISFIKEGLILDTVDIQRKLRKVFRKLGWQDVTVHTLRHTAISHWVMSGIDLFTVSKLAGHASIKMTERYAHLAPNHLIQAVSKIDFKSKEVVYG